MIGYIVTSFSSYFRKRRDTEDNANRSPHESAANGALLMSAIGDLVCILRVQKNPLPIYIQVRGMLQNQGVQTRDPVQAVTYNAAEDHSCVAGASRAPPRVANKPRPPPYQEPPYHGHMSRLL